MIKTRFSLLFAVLWASQAAGQTCKYVDAEGRVTYSNVEIKGAKKVMCFDPLPPPPATAPRPAKPAVSGGDKFPRVDAETQRKRDGSRRQILEQELANEEKLLAEARQALTEGEAVRLGGERNYQKYLDRVQKLKDDVTLHEKNVNALKQELANTR